MTSFFSIATYASAILVPIAFIIGIILLIIKYGAIPLLRIMMDKICYLLAQIVNGIKDLYGFIVAEFRKAFFEFATVFQMIAITQQRPIGDIQYGLFIAGCVSIVYLLLKKGDVDLDKIGNLLHHVNNKSNKTDGEN